MTLASRGNSGSENLHWETSRPKSSVTTRQPTLQQLLEKWVTSSQELRPMSDFLKMHLWEPDFFWFTSDVFLKRNVSSTQDSYVLHIQGSQVAKAVPRKDYFTRLRSPAKSTSSVSAWILRMMWCHEHKPQGTCCKGFCSKEGPHYCIERKLEESNRTWSSAKSTWESSRNCHRTSNNQPLFTSLEIPWGFLTQALLCYLAGAYVTQESESPRIFVRKKGMIHDRPMDVCMRNLQQKAEMGKKTGSESTTRFPQASSFKKICDVCQKYGDTRTM